MRPDPHAPGLLACGLALGALALAGCTPHIGDSCGLSTDCATDGTRICDTSEPGGYCTVLNCTGTALGSYCPDNALCVLFNANEPGCPASGYSIAPTATAECRNTCGSNSDCRGGYICRSPESPPWSARILDTNQSAMVCLPALDFVDGGVSSGSYGFDGSTVPPVCLANGPTFDAGFPPLDAGVEAAVDAPVEAAADAPADAVDAPADVAVEAAVDGASDAAPDAGADAVVDGGLDAGVDASDGATG